MSGSDRLFSTARVLSELTAHDHGKTWWVALSGGADSTALLHILCEARQSFKTTLRAVHIDHGLHPDSKHWSAWCESLCEKLGVALRCIKIKINTQSGHGLEAQARQKRYAAAAALLEPADLLLTAHHADDQAETLLLNLMRGSGVDGLAGMPTSRPLGKGHIFRPLLQFSRADLEQYLTQKGQSWIEDDSNSDLKHDRNFIRHTVLPTLETRWPSARAALNQSARHCKEVKSYLNDQLTRELRHCLPIDQVLDLAALRERLNMHCGMDGWRIMLRHWLIANGTESLPRSKLAELERQLCSSKPTSHIIVQWRDWVVHHHRDALWLQKTNSVERCPEYVWDTDLPLELGGPLGTLTLHETLLPQNQKWSVRARQAGDKIQSLTEGRHQSIKSILQNSHFPTWLRDSVPIVTRGEEIIAVGHLATSRDLRQKRRDTAGIIDWKPRDPLLIYAHDGAHNRKVDPRETLG
jgi:tRNA(Ile)-lysidine synthase